MEKIAMAKEDYVELAHLLHAVDFFAPLTIGQLEKILPYIFLCRAKSGETVFRQGDPGDAFYILKQGRVSVRLRRLMIFSSKVAALKAGDFFGEMALLSRDRRNASVVCEEDCRFFVLLAADFQSVLKQNPSFAREMAKTAENRRFMSQHA
ncbi:MAG: cyclic nucleotide-binding domain-containing protein [Elusimicrobiota bacterium]|jgi:CRP-like cAMP-binding protein